MTVADYLVKYSATRQSPGYDRVAADPRYLRVPRLRSNARNEMQTMTNSSDLLFRLVHGPRRKSTFPLFVAVQEERGPRVRSKIAVAWNLADRLTPTSSSSSFPSRPPAVLPREPEIATSIFSVESPVYRAASDPAGFIFTPIYQHPRATRIATTGNEISEPLNRGRSKGRARAMKGDD